MRRLTTFLVLLFTSCGPPSTARACWPLLQIGSNSVSYGAQPARDDRPRVVVIVVDSAQLRLVAPDAAANASPGCGCVPNTSLPFGVSRRGPWRYQFAVDTRYSRQYARPLAVEPGCTRCR
jgi:hypothetical protein